MPDRGELSAKVLDSLEEQIAVIDQGGKIVDVNAAWLQFGIRNGLAPEFISAGSNYIDVLRGSAASGDRLAGAAADGILDVLDGRRASFYFEYPCHSPEEKRWFLMRVAGLKGGPDKLFVISHHNITERKLAEEKVEYLALHDPLTGLANRRHFNEALSGELRRSVRSHSAISLMVIDVDHYKQYNDEHGHLAGDQCLVDIARILLSVSQRPGDLAARFGGDEFALILGNTDFMPAQEIAGEIQKGVQELGMTYEKSQPITVSVGVVTMSPDVPHLEGFLVEQADKALYRAKLGGRNRVVHELLSA